LIAVLRRKDQGACNTLNPFSPSEPPVAQTMLPTSKPVKMKEFAVEDGAVIAKLPALIPAPSLFP